MNAKLEKRIALSLRGLTDRSPADVPATIEGVSRLVGDVVGSSDVMVCISLRQGPCDGALDGWRIASSQRCGPNAESDARVLDQWYRADRHRAIDPSVPALIETRGRVRAFLRSDVADEQTWRDSQIDLLLAESQVRDRLVAGTPIDDGAELLLVTYRRDRQAAFGEAERNLLALLAGRLGPLGRDVARAQGLIEIGTPLTGREQEVLRLLLRGDGEATAAGRLGLTERSFHQHVVSIYRKANVHSRGELVAHFLRPERREAALAHFDRVLARREIAVLREMLGGFSEKETADRLQISERATHHVITSIYRKLGVNSRSALLARVLSVGFAGRPR